MKKNIKNLMVSVFILIIGFALTLPSVFADTTFSKSDNKNQVTVNVYLSRELLSGKDTASKDDSIITDTATNKKYKRLENRSLLVWKIDNNVEGDERKIENKKISLSNQLANFKNDYLTKKYSKPIVTKKSDKNGHIKLLLDKGATYYVRENISIGQKSPFVSSFVIVTSKDSVAEIDIHSKSVYENHDTISGRKKFVKVDFKDTNKRLKGAKFRVDKKVGDSYETIKKNGLQYIVISDEYGEFVVEDLPFGTYYLFEVNAPKGYRQLSAPVRFEIQKNDVKPKVQMIKNKIDTSGGGENRNSGGKSGSGGNKIIIPKTGDVMLALLVIGGILTSLLGHLILRDDKKKVF